MFVFLVSVIFSCLLSCRFEWLSNHDKAIGALDYVTVIATVSLLVLSFFFCFVFFYCFFLTVVHDCRLLLWSALYALYVR